MSVFLLVGGVLLVGVLVALLYPLLKGQPSENAEATGQRELNLQVLREQLADLEKDLDEGRLSEAAYRQSREELERRALDYVGEAPKAVVAGGRKTVLAIVLAIGFPLAVGGLYWALGEPQAVVASKTAGAAKEGEHALSQQQITAMVERLALRLQDNPNDGAGWLMLARSYAVLGRYPESAAAFSRAVSMLPPDAQHYADYADIVAMAQGKRLAGEPEKLVRRALEIDPKNVKALALAGTIAFDHQDYATAIRQWQTVLAVLPEDSAAAAGIQGSIRDAENRMAISGKQAAGMAPPAKVSGVIELDPKLGASIKPGDTLFVFARAVDGPKMPVAMLRAKASELPLNFSLDDSMAMAPQFKLSSVGPVVVGARISKSGDALARSGDLEGLSTPVSAGVAGVRIVINSTVR
ncbi:MAG: ccmI [Proteobacteria bacterium]|nr:ccmI [Pseudomonadota bacterium]